EKINDEENEFSLKHLRAIFDAKDTDAETFKAALIKSGKGYGITEEFLRGVEFSGELITAISDAVKTKMQKPTREAIIEKITDAELSLEHLRAIFKEAELFGTDGHDAKKFKDVLIENGDDEITDEFLRGVEFSEELITDISDAVKEKM